ncbi:MAG: ATP synthase F1 subunit delta [Alphaproteobacteria bacterium]
MSENSTTTPVAGDHAAPPPALVRRYVGSLYTLAEQEGSIDAVAADMRGLRRLWNESAEWRFIASDPRIHNESANKAVEQVAKISAVGKLTAQFLSVVALNRRLNLMPALVEGFLEEVATRRGEYHADVRTANALSAAQHEALTASLTAVMGGKVHINMIEDASILGGLTVKLGSQFIDASVKTKLDHLERSLKGAA